MDRMHEASEAGAAAASAAASTALGAKLIAVVVSAGASVLGALMMILLDPPPTRRGRWMQAVVSSVGGVICGPISVRILDHYVDAIDLTNADPISLLEVAAPVFLLTGAMFWGVAGAESHARRAIAEHGWQIVAQWLRIRRRRDSDESDEPR